MNVDNNNRTLTVAHDVSDLQEGETVIMTLQDAPIIDGNEYNDFQDTLHNSEMTKDFRREFQQKVNERLSGNMYDPSSDDILGGTMLPQYDEHDPQKQGFMLDHDNLKMQTQKAKMMDSISGKLGVQTKDYFDLNVEKKVASEFMTREEFRKGKKDKKKRKNKKNKKKKKSDFSFLRQLEEEAVDDMKEELGKRGVDNVNLNLEEDIVTTQRKKLKIYKNAIFNDTANTQTNDSFKDNVTVLNDEEDTGVDLAKMLKTAKNRARDKNKKVEEKMKELMEQNNEASILDEPGVNQSSKKANYVEFDEEEDAFDQIKKKAKEMGREYTETDEQKKMNILTLKDQRTGMTSIVDVMLPSERLKKLAQKKKYIIPSLRLDIDKKKASDSKKNENGTENTSAREQIDTGIEELNAVNITEEVDANELRSSTAAVLDMFRKRGMLDKKKNTTYVGRAKDRKFLDEMDRVGADPNNRVRLEYRDKETGRLQTQKEAFNEMCAQFHNIKKSKKKQMKIRRKQDALHDSKFSNPLQSKSYMLMRAMQQHTGQAHVDLSKAMKK